MLSCAHIADIINKRKIHISVFSRFCLEDILVPIIVASVPGSDVVGNRLLLFSDNRKYWSFYYYLTSFFFRVAYHGITNMLNDQSEQLFTREQAE
jgi:hypothetical protein